MVVPMSILYNHLYGEQAIGVYPLLADNSCNFMAVDFDEEDWKEDPLAFVQSCFELGVPAALEISRSAIRYTGIGYANILERNATTVCRSITP